VIDVVGVSDRLDLQTLPRLFGLRRPVAAGETAIEAFERQTREDHSHPRRPTSSRQRKPDGQMRSRDVELLGARRRKRKLSWLRHGSYWLLSIGQGGLLALAPAGERRTVVRLDRGRLERLAVDVDLAYAHRSAPSWPTPNPIPPGTKRFRFANLERQRRSPQPLPPSPIASVLEVLGGVPLVL
jgi:hypothetical protein